MTNSNTFPPIFAKYLKDNSIDPDFYSLEGSKYFYSKCSLVELKLDAVGQADLKPCDLLPNFFSVAPSFAFSSSKSYQEGLLLPMDISSGMAVHLLNLLSSDHVLDLCCAPGGKLVLSGLLMSREFCSQSPEKNGSLTGVDIAEHRLATCRSLVKKYKIPRTRLFCADGTTFDIRVRRFCRNSSNESITATKAFHETTDYRKRPSAQSSEFYDKVLVDAQCTHDGSFKHIRKHMKVDWKGFDLSQFEPEKLNDLYRLQLALLENGFRLLKPGGIIVYSTCSLSVCQNQEIIESFLNRNADAEPLPFEGDFFFKTMRPPEHDSGFFISRFTKKTI